MNSLKFKLFIYRAKEKFISILNMVAILLLSYFFNKWFEMFIFMLTYNLIRCEFLLAVHGSDFVNSPSKSIILCRIITFIIQLTSIMFLISIDMSKFLNTFLASSLGAINYLLKFYLQRTLNLEFKIRDMTSLKTLCENAQLSELATRRMFMRYIEKKSIKEIAEIEMVEEATIIKSINRTRKKFNM